MSAEVARCLSLTQPWAWLVAFGGKSIENRTWDTKYRGPVLIHAAKGMTVGQLAFASKWCRDRFGIDYPPFPEAATTMRGGFVARAKLVDVVRPYASSEPPPDYPEDIDPVWHMQDQFGFILRSIEPVPFTPWKGALGLWKAPVWELERAMYGTAHWLGAWK